MWMVPVIPGPPQIPSSFWSPWATNTVPTVIRRIAGPYARIQAYFDTNMFRMMTRRTFLTSGTTSAVALAAFTNESLARVAAAGARARDTAPGDLAADETYWREIQQAFTLDRTLINLNNGGCSPSPRVVHEAFKRYLDISNQAPVYHMWQILEPNIESVRRRLAREFGCDAEEMAITRNASEALQIAQLGIDLKPGDEVVTTNQDYGRMLDTWDQRVRRDGITVKQISFPVPPPSMDDL